MGRKPKEAGIGHNGPEPLTDDEQADLIAYYGDKIRRQQRTAAEAKAEYDAERTEVNSLFALVKGELQISRKDFEALLLAQDMTEAEFLHAEAKRHSLYALAGLPVGAQIDLFANAADTADDQAHAYANGKRAGLRGDDPVPPATTSPILHPDWMRGWTDGQAELGERMVRAAALIEARKPAPVAEVESDEEDPDPTDPEAVDAAARKLKRSGFMDRAEADAEAELADA